SGTFARAACTIWTVRSSARMSFSEPLKARPIGERAVETMTASVIEYVAFDGRERSKSQVAADEFLHDLVGAGPDLGDAGIAPGAGDPVFVHEPVAAV